MRDQPIYVAVTGTLHWSMQLPIIRLKTILNWTYTVQQFSLYLNLIIDCNSQSEYFQVSIKVVLILGSLEYIWCVSSL